MRLPDLLARIVDGTISGKLAKDVFEAMWIGARGRRTRSSPPKDSGRSRTPARLSSAIADVMAANPGQLADYRSGKDKLFGFFVGQVMKATGGKANPAQVNELLKRMLAGP